jgi:predicted TIM-barrel fold metal-dependent hydrolase
MAQVRGTKSRSAQIREELGYPVLDGDGHIVELFPVFADFVRDHGGGFAIDAFTAGRGGGQDLSPEDRRRGGLIPHSWHVPSSTEYYATVTSPARYHDRLGEAGIDFAVLYPTMGIALLQVLDDEQRVTLCRLYNEFMADQYRSYDDRFTVAALIPMNTPDEATGALTHAKGLGAKVGVMASHVHRPVPGEPWPPKDQWASMRIPEWEVNGWIDTFGIDSAYDYDPVWAKAIELEIPLSAHTAGIGFSDRASISNFVYNQIGHFAASGAALAKSLFLGGVTSRFPRLRVALLEGGAAVGVETFIGLMSTWQKRGGPAIRTLNPDNVDRELLHKLLTDSDPRLSKYSPEQLMWHGTMKEPRDDFAATSVTSAEDVRDLFCTPFYWGCEADDPLVGLAFDTRITPLAARLPAFFASDLGHWDVPEFEEPLEEAYELVERGILSPKDFRDFVFATPVRFYGSLNPDFFAGTSIEKEASEVLVEECP